MTDVETLQKAASLLDGAMEIIEDWGDTDAQREWRNEWMIGARDVIRQICGDERRKRLK